MASSSRFITCKATSLNKTDFKAIGFPIKDARFSKLKNILDLLSLLGNPVLKETQ